MQIHTYARAPTHAPEYEVCFTNGAHVDFLSSMLFHSYTKRYRQREHQTPIQTVVYVLQPSCAGHVCAVTGAVSSVERCSVTPSKHTSLKMSITSSSYNLSASSMLICEP